MQTTETTALDEIRRALARLDQASERHRRNGNGPQHADARSLAYLAWQEKDEAAAEGWVDAELELIRLVREHTPEIQPACGGFGPNQPIHAIRVDGRLLMLLARPGSVVTLTVDLDLYILDDRAIGGGA